MAREKPRLPARCSQGVATFLSLMDKVVVDRRVPTSATAIDAKGTIMLILGEQFQDGGKREREEMLKHEASHFYLQHLHRFPGEPGNQGDLTLWNLVTDAAMHYLGGCHRGDPSCVTWERIGLSPMAPELAYEILKERVEELEAQGCGSLAYSSRADTLEAKIAGMSASMTLGGEEEFKHLAQGPRGGHGHGAGAYIELPPPPSWIRETFDYLLKVKADERRRSWRRENRQTSLLPGQSSTHGLGALFLIDSSASISNETLGQFIAAVQSTPELNGSTCAIFDSEVTARVPVGRAQATLASHGRGGTDFIPPAGLRQSGETVVWLTDGYPCGPWPEPHTDLEVWCMTTDVVPPHGIRVQAAE